MATSTASFRRVYVWELPVRIYHWVTAVSVAALVGTGLVIGDPPAFMTAADASSTSWFAIVRLVHFSAGFLFFFMFLLRVYWLFAGNEYANWRAFLPLTPTLFRRQVRDAVRVVRTDIVQIDRGSLEHVGHNALAAWSYVGVFLLTIVAASTGLALYAPMSGWWLPNLFAWIVPAFGGDAPVRFVHHLTVWLFIVFAIIHVYLSLFHDVVEGKGEISSMVSGTRFVDRS